MANELSWGFRYLATEPRHFTVCYRINPWMVPTVDEAGALAQWKEVVAALERAGAQVELCEDEPGLPDMAFTMNAGFVVGRRAVVSRFRHPERRPEEPHWRARFEALGLEVVDLPAPDRVRFEAGDLFLVGDTLVGGYGFRSDREGLEAVANVVDRPLVAVRLVDDRFYHFDTCFCPLGGGRALVHLGAVAPEHRDALAAVVPDALQLREEEALTFCANSAVVGDVVVTAGCPPRVEDYLAGHGFRVETVDVGEFHKSGGSVRCLTLPIDLPERQPTSPATARS